MWLFAVITGHFFNFGAFVVDKYLLSKEAPEPLLYAVIIGIGGLLAFLLYPFGVYMLPLEEFLLSLFSGASFVVALIFFFSSLKNSEASRVVTLVGATQPLLIFFLARWWLGEQLLPHQFIAFVLLVIGGTIMSWKSHGSRGHSCLPDRQARTTPTRNWIISALLAALFFSLSFVVVKGVFTETNFLSGLVWSRLGGGIMAGILFLIPSFRKRILAGFRRTTKKTRAGSLALGSQLAGIGGFVLITYGISLGSVTLVQSLQGIQYMFLFFLVLFFSWKYPNIIHEKISAKILFQKFISLIFIGVGLMIL